MICIEEDTDGRARVTTDEARVLPEDWTEMSVVRLAGCKNFVGTVSERSLYSMRSLILSQCRDLRMGVIREDLGALTTVRARQFWICWNQLFVVSNNIIMHYPPSIVQSTTSSTETLNSTCSCAQLKSKFALRPALSVKWNWSTQVYKTQDKTQYSRFTVNTCCRLAANNR